MLLSFSIFLMNRMISSGASLFDHRKNNHVYLEYSSTITRVYFFPPMDWTLTGPKKSMWRRCRGEVIEEICLDLKPALVCFSFLTCRTKRHLCKAKIRKTSNNLVDG